MSQYDYFSPISKEERKVIRELSDICEKYNITHDQLSIMLEKYDNKHKCRITGRVMSNIYHDWNTKMRLKGETSNRIWYDGEYFGG